MPTYEYRCNNCQQEFQVKLSWRDKAGVRCPSCQSNDVKELLGRYEVHVGAGSAKDLPPQCRGCDHPSPGCPGARA